MDWYPLYNSLRIALISTVIIFFAGIAAAYYVARLPRVLKGVLDVLFTLPLVLPPTVVGYLLLRVLGPKRAKTGRKVEKMRGNHSAAAPQNQKTLGEKRQNLQKYHYSLDVV